MPLPGPSVRRGVQHRLHGGLHLDVVQLHHSDLYWTSTTYVGSPDFAWYVYFVDGNILANQKTNGGYVRAVRSGS